MRIETVREGRTAVVTAEGELDSATAYDVFLAVAAAAGRGHRTVVLDLSAVRFIDSSGLSMLLRSRTELADSYDARLVLRSPGNRVRHLLEITAMSDQFVIDSPV